MRKCTTAFQKVMQEHNQARLKHQTRSYRDSTICLCTWKKERRQEVQCQTHRLQESKQGVQNGENAEKDNTFQSPTSQRWRDRDVTCGAYQSTQRPDHYRHSRISAEFDSTWISLVLDPLGFMFGDDWIHFLFSSSIGSCLGELVSGVRCPKGRATVLSLSDTNRHGPPTTCLVRHKKKHTKNQQEKSENSLKNSQGHKSAYHECGVNVEGGKRWVAEWTLSKAGEERQRVRAREKRKRCGK